jgi:hypothetical protein
MFRCETIVASFAVLGLIGCAEGMESANSGQSPFLQMENSSLTSSSNGSSTLTNPFTSPSSTSAGGTVTGTSSGVATGTGTTIQTAVNPATIKIENSLMITRPSVLNGIQDKYDFGYLLGEVSESVKNQRNRKVLPGEFVDNMFMDALREQQRHNDSANRLGAKLGNDRNLSAVYRNWLDSSVLSKLDKPAKLRGGPFRLLAVVNLMDAAGTKDDRGLSEATKDPRALGEMHLVYGLIDRDHEKSTGRPFPQTFVLTYRLPVLEWSGNGTGLQLAKSPSLQTLMSGDVHWKNKMKLWADLWARLSEHPLNSPEFTNRLNGILSFIVRPENFLNARSNLNMGNGEFEIREWYMIQGNQMLIPKKPHNEPYRCLSGTRDLTKLVDYFWRPDYNDLDMTTYRPNLPLRSGNNGYSVFRDSGDGRKLYNGYTSWDGCGRQAANMPFEMEVDLPNDVKMVAPFGRVKSGQVWELAPGTPEVRRHAFAIRTCTGCHSDEGATNGFHIHPRLQGEESKLSPFLTGTGANTFTKGGTTYRYQILQHRKNWLVKSLNGTAELKQALLRPEVPH